MVFIGHALFIFFFSSRRRHTRFDCDWSSDVCSSDLDKVIGCTFINVDAWAHKKGGMIGRSAGARPGIVLRGDVHFGDKYTAAQAAAKIGRASCRERV